MTPVNVQEAFSWIVSVLKKHHISFQIVGGLAAIHYGVNRELYDIDIDIAEDSFKLILSDVSPFIIFGPARFKDKNWDIYLLTLNYKGQLIDIGGAHQTKIYNSKSDKWELLKVDFSLAKKADIYGENVAVIPRNDLIHYKSILKREVDLQDLEVLQPNLRFS